MEKLISLHTGAAIFVQLTLFKNRPEKFLHSQFPSGSKADKPVLLPTFLFLSPFPEKKEKDMGGPTPHVAPKTYLFSVQQMVLFLSQKFLVSGSLS